jgi:hypothetical protein
VPTRLARLDAAEATSSTGVLSASLRGANSLSLQSREDSLRATARALCRRGQRCGAVRAWLSVVSRQAASDCHGGSLLAGRARELVKTASGVGCGREGLYSAGKSSVQYSTATINAD